MARLTTQTATPAHDRRMLDELARQSKVQQARSDRIEELLIRMADVKAVETSLITSFDGLADCLTEQLAPLRAFESERKDLEDEQVDRLNDLLASLATSTGNINKELPVLAEDTAFIGQYPPPPQYSGNVGRGQRGRSAS